MPEYGYKEGERPGRERSLSRKRSKAEKKLKKQGKEGREDKPRKRARTDDRMGQSGGDGMMPPVAAPRAPRAPQGDDRARYSSWREELEKTEAAEAPDSDDDLADGGIVPVETDEDVDRKLAESRARREALMAKWVNRGEDGETGMIKFENTNTPLADEEQGSDNEEVTAFFAAKQKELQSASTALDEKAIEERKAVARFILEARGEHNEMFDENPEAQEALQKAQDTSAAISQTGASGDDWNDAEGYYKAKIGELMDGRYRVTEDVCGKGTFSNVIKAEDEQKKMQVAIKVMRCNDMMRKAAEKEIELLERLRDSDKDGKRNVIRLFRTFVYRGHLCLVFECMWDNLRVALKKYTKDKGMSLKAVRAYTRQLLVALQHIHRLQIIHADIKPDNILISAGHNVTKICDLGSAMELTEVEVTPYLVSRFYRAPEIVLGIKYGPPADTFALGASLCECFTGKILFPGKSNNDMLRHFMEWKGKFTKSMIKSGTTWKQHFDENLDFKYLDYDKVTRKRKSRIITDCSAKKSIFDCVMQRVGPEKQKSDDREDQIYVKKAKQFADLVNQMTMLDPEKRPTPTDLLKHAFVAEAWPSPKGTPGGKGGTPKA